MDETPRERVEPCFRCGQAAEEPAVGSGHVAGQERVPLCVQCLELLKEVLKGERDATEVIKRQKVGEECRGKL
jgi:hypothetical protein